MTSVSDADRTVQTMLLSNEAYFGLIEMERGILLWSVRGSSHVHNKYLLGN